MAAYAALGVALILMVSSDTAAQVVRGRVTQEASAEPVAGALIELLFADSADARAATALSDPSGSYELRAPGSGRYRVRAKRIGARRFTSEPFTLGMGQTRTEEIVLAAIDYRLPEVVVTASALCSVNPNDRIRVAVLWEEARTALDATEISLRDKLFSADVTRYVRALDPKTLRVLDEARSEVRGVVASPFNALSAESLSTVGYWRELPSGGTSYYGPDPGILLSDAFLGDHCFRPTEGSGDRAGLTGLAFLPASERHVPDVAGTIWLDAKSHELRLVEFRYDRVRAGVDSAVVGGELHFVSLPNGAWLVQRWFLRVPVLGRSTQPVTTEGNSPWVLLRPTGFHLIEEGGTVVADVLRVPARPASLAGVVRDSSGTGYVAGAVVRLGGSTRTTLTDDAGRFAFDSLAPGAVTLLVAAAGYDTLGTTAASTTVQLAAAERQTVTLTALDARALTQRLCGGEGAWWGRGTLHATLRDAATSARVAGARVTLQWNSTVGRPPGDSIPERVARVSDDRGDVTFCQVPSDRPLTLQATHATRSATTRVEATIRPREVRHLEVVLAAGRPNE